jgi:hypothetical protein
MPSVFFSYSHADEGLRDQLEKQLAMLKRQGVIDIWHDRRIGAGQNIDQAIDEHINSDEIILLLVSADFLASDYCYDVEMKRAMERHNSGEAIVIPVILRACDWHNAPFGKLNATPRDGKPITQWADIDEAFLQVVKAIRDAITHMIPVAHTSTNRKIAAAPVDAQAGRMPGPRSSNLRLAKTFTQREKDQFQLDTFEFVARFFQNSLAELGTRNSGFEGIFRRVDATRFFAAIYHNGNDVARATVFMGGEIYNRGISYVMGETMNSNSLNESLSVQADDQMLYLSCTGMALFGQHRDQKLSQEGAAELFWSMLIDRLQS